MSTFSLTIIREEISGNTSLFTNITNSSLVLSVFGEYSTDSTTKEFTFDRNIQRQTVFNVTVATFGDGYEQRARNGINPKNETFAVTFNNKTNEEIEVISAFLDNKTGANFNIVLNGQTIKVACEQYSITYGNVNNQSLQTSLRRVYEP